MKKFFITVEETVVGSFEVYADNMEKALEKVTTGYINCEYVLEPGDLTAKKIMGECEDTGETTEWIDF